MYIVYLFKREDNYSGSLEWI